MTIAAKFRVIDTHNISEWEYPLAAAVLIKQGDGVIHTATGIKAVTGTLADGVFLGYSANEYDNRDGAAGDVRGVVKFHRTFPCVVLPVGAAGVPTVADIGKTLYFDALSCVTTATGGPAAGRLMGFWRDGRAMVASV